jgi:hypothetical protein
MNRRLLLIGLALMLLVAIVGCGVNEAGEGALGGDNEEAGIIEEEYELTEDGIIQPGLAREIIAQRADELLEAIAAKDGEAMAEFVHRVKGVRFSPYAFVSLEEDQVFDKEGMQDFFRDDNIYLWGIYDGIGDEINLTHGEYYDEFIYTWDFKNAEEVGYNEVLSGGNTIENQFEVYENPIIVEYYFPGLFPEDGAMDWKGLRLVFEQYEGEWVLVGIIHSQWTI